MEDITEDTTILALAITAVIAVRLKKSLLPKKLTSWPKPNTTADTIDHTVALTEDITVDTALATTAGLIGVEKIIHLQTVQP